MRLLMVFSTECVFSQGKQVSALAGSNADCKRSATREMILENDESVKMYTGLKSKEVVLNLYAIITKKINYWRGPKKTKTDNSNPHPGGRAKVTDWFDDYLVTLVYIREGLSMNILASWFSLSISSVSSIILTWVNLMYCILNKYIRWPSADEIKKTLPGNYSQKYSDIIIIIIIFV
ncbi:hypothetical protein Pmani_015186 [Petrolisthes manimaculis]|uniref:Transposase Helix-turn-helix domain-containing protein n=1 Tax=Petrolisthes manimaculis TaxID=1843537 RepID=A0AAE1U7W0_9EUCA|nr:hypothetical protein Pmani_015186 [Petrolisthes manimaculis]